MRTANAESFNDALGDIFMAIANAKLSPDADLGFLNKIEMVVMGRLKTPPTTAGRSAATRTAWSTGRGCATGSAAWWRLLLVGQQSRKVDPHPHAAIPPPDMDQVRDTIAQTTGP